MGFRVWGVGFGFSFFVFFFVVGAGGGGGVRGSKSGVLGFSKRVARATLPSHLRGTEDTGVPSSFSFTLIRCKRTTAERLKCNANTKQVQGLPGCLG